MTLGQMTRRRNLRAALCGASIPRLGITGMRAWASGTEDNNKPALLAQIQISIPADHLPRNRNSCLPTTSPRQLGHKAIAHLAHIRRRRRHLGQTIEPSKDHLVIQQHNALRQDMFGGELGHHGLAIALRPNPTNSCFSADILDLRRHTEPTRGVVCAASNRQIRAKSPGALRGGHSAGTKSKGRKRRE